MNEYLPGMEGEARKRDLSQFYTEPELAKRIVAWAIGSKWTTMTRRMLALEPTAGRGAIVDALLNHAVEDGPLLVERVDAIELDPQNVEYLRARYQGWDRVCVVGGDFLKLSAGASVAQPHYDIAVQNTPFENGQTEAFILHSLKLAKYVIAHVPVTTLAGQKRREGLWSEAYLKRMIIHSARPEYGDGGGKTDMATIEVVRRPEGNKPTNGRVASYGVDIEWWL